MIKPLAWGLVALALLLIGSATAVTLASGTEDALSGDVFAWAITLVFAATGLLIALRQPANAIGWLFLGVAVGAGLGSLTGAYADYWVDSGAGSEALGKTAAWYADMGWMAFVLVPATFVLLLFPDGRLPSPRWRPIAWCAGFGIAGNFLATGLHSGRLEDHPQVRNPIGVDSSLVDALQGLTFLVLAVAVIGSAVSLIFRYRGAGHEQRQQVKWLALAGAVAAVTLIVGFSVYDVVGATAANSMIMLSILGVPVATGIAILRYRLYDIDVVINRALVYGALTATLAVAYLSSVLLLQLALSGVTGGSGLAVAASTLAAAALFRPARARIQAGVDHRFYRRKYDAERTLERFSVRLRNELDLEALNAELSALVRETFQPAHVSLWLRVPEE